MLAKVLKSREKINFAQFAFPEIGEKSSPSKKYEAFVIPDLNAFETVEKEPESVVEPEISTPELTKVLQKTHDEAAKIIAKAEADSEMIAAAAREKAVGEVEAKFETEVSERVSEQCAEIRGRLAQTIGEISILADKITERAESQLVELALAVAKKIVGREVTIDREIALTLVKVSLAKLHNRSIAEVHLNPEDFNFVETHREKLDFRGSLEIVEDKSISVGGCLIHTETGDIDARIESQFDEIAHGLLGN